MLFFEKGFRSPSRNVGKQLNSDVAIHLCELFAAKKINTIISVGFVMHAPLPDRIVRCLTS